MSDTDLSLSGATRHGVHSPGCFDAARTAAPDRTVATTWPARGGALTLHLAAVAAPDCFSLAWFERHGIDLPPRIARSVPKRQAEYFAGRLCARAGIAALGVRHGQVDTGALSAPVWPAGLTGSISHSAALAVAAVLPAADCRGVGIDVEPVPDQAGLDDLRAVALNENERRLVAAGSMAQDILVTALFSAKESFFKATAGAVGRYFDFSAIECVDAGPDTLTCVIREPLAAGLQPGLLCRFDLALWQNHVLTCFRW